MRHEEAQAAARLQGIEDSVYGTHLDGELGTHSIRAIGAEITDLARKHHITAIATPGVDGFCGHTDHITVHQAALAAQDNLAVEGIDVPVLALRSDGQGELRIAVDSFRKKRLVGVHRSQMPVDSLGNLHSRFFRDHPEYIDLFGYETFDVIRSRSMGAAATRHAVAA